MNKQIVKQAMAKAAFATIILFSMIANAQSPSETIYPSSLNPGDKIAILAPAGPMDPSVVDSAAMVLRQVGYDPIVFPTAYGKHGYFSGTEAERTADLKAALTDPEIRAVLCARGGYGAALILDSLATIPLEKDPKWVIGFSDISALHALMASRNIASIHSSMAKQIALGPDDPDNATLFEILQGRMPRYVFSPDSCNHLGKATGRIVGGNLAVIQALINTPYDIIQPNTILFIEDVSEPIYKIERIVYQLRMAGILSRLKGLIIGQFTDYQPDALHPDMNDMFAKALADYPDLPVAFNIPIGHVDHNVPIVESAWATLDITPQEVTLTFER